MRLSRLSKLLTVPLLALGLAVGSGCNVPEAERGSLSSHSDVTYRPYREIMDSMRALTVKNSSLFTFHQYGTTLGGEVLFTLKMRDINQPARPGAPAVVITEAIHGEEYLNITDRLPESFEKNIGPGLRSLLDVGGSVYFVPVVNPDGYKLKRRVNDNGADLNRDFPGKTFLKERGFLQPELKQWATFIDNEVKNNNQHLAVVMDYHCCFGGVLHPWGQRKLPNGRPAPKIPAGAMQIFLTAGAMIANHFNYALGDVQKVLSYEAEGTSFDYYYETYGTLALGFEGVRKEEPKKLQLHVTYWDKLFAIAKNVAEAGNLQKLDDPNPPQNDVMPVLVRNHEGRDSLLISVPGAVANVEVCNGTRAECSAAGAPVVATIAAQNITIKDRRIFELNDFSKKLDLKKNIVLIAKSGQNQPLMRVLGISPR